MDVTFLTFILYSFDYINYFAVSLFLFLDLTLILCLEPYNSNDLKSNRLTSILTLKLESIYGFDV